MRCALAAAVIAVACAVIPGVVAARPAEGPNTTVGAGAVLRGPLASAAATRTAKLKDSYFSPSTITVKGTTTVRFVWAGELAHNLAGRGIPSKYLKAKVRHRTLSRTYGRGVYTFLCTIHPGMELKLRVR